MVRSIALHVVLACVLGIATFASGDASAQALSCAGDMPSPKINVLAQIYVNRDTPMGPLTASPPQPHAGAGVYCTGGQVGTPIEVALRVHPSLRATPNPWSSGLLLETTVPGIGIVLQTLAPAMMTNDFQVVHTTTRDHLPTQILPSVTLRVQIARHGEIDVLNNHALHGIPLLEMAWRAPGVQDDWQWVTTWSLSALTPGMRNIISETCFIGPDPTVPYARTVQLGSVKAGDLPGIGQEAPGLNVSGTVEVTCRNYAGGRMTVDSTHKHATMPGVLLNSLGTSDAAQGIGPAIEPGDGRLRTTAGGTARGFGAEVWNVGGTKRFYFDGHKADETSTNVSLNVPLGFWDFEWRLGKSRYERLQQFATATVWSVATRRIKTSRSAACSGVRNTGRPTRACASSARPTKTSSTVIESPSIARPTPTWCSAWRASSNSGAVRSTPTSTGAAARVGSAPTTSPSTWKARHHRCTTNTRAT